MKNERNRAVLKDCLKQFRFPLLLFAAGWGMILIIFILYGLAPEPFGYAFTVTLLLLLSAFGIRYAAQRKKAALRQRAADGILNEWNALPAPENLAEADWQRMAETLGAEKERLAAAFAEEQRETQDFYTAWVHRIKTPIAVMKLALGSSEEPDRAALQEELFRIEQYTNMVLAYQRLGSGSNDLVIREYALDEVIREVIREFAPQFIYRKLRLSYEGTDLLITTDRKWLKCILEQLVSNAVKYTDTGTVTISAGPETLRVEDTGAGIAAEDLPRIFEKGYTGINGRLSDRSSGLGLYLCGRAAGMLNIGIRAESTPGKGSCFILETLKTGVSAPAATVRDD